MVVTVVDAARLVAGVDYPGTLQELSSWFGTEAACRAYLEQLRWPDGFACPRCDGRDAWRTAEGLFLCVRCRRKVSVTAGTLFHRSKIPLTTWFCAAWLMCADKGGVAALSVQRELGLGSYKTAWMMAQKLRRAMVIPSREKLSGLVEVDETYVGAREPGVDGRLVYGKAIVVIAVELHEHRLGRARLAIVPGATKAHIYDFVTRTVQPGSTIRTDGWSLYNEIADVGYVHEKIAVKHTGLQAHEALPGVHRVASLLKRFIAGTLHSGISHDHLDYYLDEFVFRFNRRSSRSRGLLFYRLLEQAVHTDPAPFEEIVGGDAAYI